MGRVPQFLLTMTVLATCNCTPYFHTVGRSKCPQICAGPSLLCMNKIFDQIGEYRDVQVANEDGTTRTANCLEPCEDQKLQVSITMTRLPNRQTLLKWNDVCLLMERLQKLCGNEWKRIMIDERYPSLCILLNDKLSKHPSPEINDKREICKRVTESFKFNSVFNSCHSSRDALIKEIYQYVRENIAIVNIYIQPPVVTRIIKGERIPNIWFIANCGGILGLCMGFSLVSAFELLHFIVQFSFFSCQSFTEKYYKNDNLRCKRSEKSNETISKTINEEESYDIELS